ncbi:glycosyltransferase, partial [bacterium]|nr:glycosyltransferase [bacterium]
MPTTAPQIPGTEPGILIEQIQTSSWMDADPTVSVIIPCCNGERSVREAMDSIVRQSFRRVELIVVDDSSSDNSFAAIQSFQRHDEQFPILALRREGSGGRPGLVRNTGIAKARADFIVCLDADDQLLPDTLERMMKRAGEASGTRPVVYGAYERFGTRDGRWPWPVRPIEPNALIRQNHISIATLFAKPLWEEVGGFTGMKGYEDWEFWISTARLGAEFLPIPDVLYRVRFDSPDSVNHKAKRSHEWLVAQIILQHEDIYEPEEVQWAHEFLTAWPDAPPDPWPRYPRDTKHPLPAALRIAAWPGYYPEEEVLWASQWLGANPPVLRRGLHAAGVSSPRRCGIVSGSPRDILNAAEQDSQALDDHNHVIHPTSRTQHTDTSETTGRERSGTVASTAGRSPIQRVLFICHDFPPHRFAGAQLYALMIAKELVARGIQVDVFHPVFRGELGDDYRVYHD